MPSRHRSRQRAVQILYQWDMRKLPVDYAIDAFYQTLYTEEAPEEQRDELPRPERDKFMEDLVRGAVQRAGDIDQRIGAHSANWRVDRMPIVDRNILRLAVYEMLAQITPPAVAIDEALELARRFSGDESVSFINGVLDAVQKDLPRQQ